MGCGIVASALGQVSAFDSGAKGNRIVLTKTKFVVARALCALERLVKGVAANVHTCLHFIARQSHGSDHATIERKFELVPVQRQQDLFRFEMHLEARERLSALSQPIARDAPFEHAQLRDRFLDCPVDVLSIAGQEAVEVNAVEAHRMLLGASGDCK